MLGMYLRQFLPHFYLRELFESKCTTRWPSIWNSRISGSLSNVLAINRKAFLIGNSIAPDNLIEKPEQCSRCMKVSAYSGRNSSLGLNLEIRQRQALLFSILKMLKSTKAEYH